MPDPEEVCLTSEDVPDPGKEVQLALENTKEVRLTPVGVMTDTRESQLIPDGPNEARQLATLPTPQIPRKGAGS